MKRQYVKPFKNYEEQVELLTSRGLAPRNRDEAVRFLSYVNYYRFTGYAYIFKNLGSETYRSDVAFEDVVALYRFDRALRSIIADGIALIEIYARTKIAHFIAEKYGPFGHANEANFLDRRSFKRWRDMACHEAEASVKKPFGVASTRHFREVYAEWPNLPIWILTDILPFGNLTRLFSLLGESDQKKIANEFGLKSGEVLNSWFGTLTATRNICAHFERLWNRTTRVAPSIPNTSEWDFVRDTNRKIFPVFTMVKYSLDVIAEKTSESTDWKERFCKIMEARPRGPLDDEFYRIQMGFDPDWRTREIWKR